MLGCNVRYIVRICYNCYQSSEKSDVSYSVLALNKEDSIKIAKNIFYTEYDNLYNDSIFLIESKLDRPTVEEILFVNEKLSSVYGFIKDSFLNMDYKKFIKSYLGFSGSGMIFDRGTVSYLVKFNGFTFRVTYKEGVCFVEEDEVSYYSSDNNRCYVIRDDCTTILIGS